MLKLAAALGLCICVFAGPDHPDWLAFKQEHGKEYVSLEEEHQRFQQFMKTKQEVDEHNQEFQEGKHTYWKGINKFSDWSDEEMDSLFGLAPITPEEEEEKERVNSMVQSNYAVPNEINWVKKGAVAPVQDQGHCGSCWTFASAAALEGRIAVKKGRLPKLSEQNLLDCTGLSDSCRGGRPKHAYEYVARNDGIDTEQAYPYIGQQYYCQYDPQSKGGSDTGYRHVPAGEAGLKQAVAEGPVSVGVDAHTWKYYQGGVYSCPYTGQLNHAVTVVGYGSDPTYGDYWLVKNSWGTSYGENGYIRVSRNGGDNCGIAQDGTYPTV